MNQNPMFIKIGWQQLKTNFSFLLDTNLPTTTDQSLQSADQQKHEPFNPSSSAGHSVNHGHNFLID
jgi:hypothetical protein